jgi:hypothetical protein
VAGWYCVLMLGVLILGGLILGGLIGGPGGRS